MSLRTRLFLFFGGLIALLVSGQWVMARSMTKDLKGEAGQTALYVGQSLMNVVLDELPCEELGLDGENADVRRAYAFGLRAGDALSAQDDVLAVLAADESLDRETVEQVIERLHALHAVPEHMVVTGNARAADGEPRVRQTEALVIERQLDVDELTTDGQALLEAWVTDEDVEVHEDAEGGKLVKHFRRSVSDGKAIFQIKLTNDVYAARDHEHQDDALALDVTWERGSLFPNAQRPGELSKTIPIPQSGFDQASDRFLSRLLLGSFAILGLGLVVAGYVAHRVSTPLSSLARAARDVGDGALGTQVDARGDRELTATIGAFNHMSTRLSELDREARSLREREHLTEIGELARGLAHSLRNPLNVLGLAVEELASHDDEEQREQLARSARAQINRIDQSLRSFLALSTGGAGDVHAVAMEDVARDVALELMQDVHLPNRVRVAAEGPVAQVAGVEAELRAVLHTLVVNAVEASPPGGVVTVTIEALPNGARVAVCDEGPGIAPQIRERLFTPHVTTKERGAGMGLFLAERIIKNRYEGELTLTDNEPRGTCAVLTLNARKAEAHA